MKIESGKKSASSPPSSLTAEEYIFAYTGKQGSTAQHRRQNRPSPSAESSWHLADILFETPMRCRALRGPCHGGAYRTPSHQRLRRTTAVCFACCAPSSTWNDCEHACCVKLTITHKNFTVSEDRWHDKQGSRVQRVDNQNSNNVRTIESNRSMV